MAGSWTLQGTSLVTLPPLSSVSRPISRAGGLRTTLYGNYQQDQFPNGKKITYTISWDGLVDADFDLLLQFEDGRQGSGPFTLIDPRYPTVHRTVLVVSLTDDSPIDGWRSPVAFILQEV